MGDADAWDDVDPDTLGSRTASVTGNYYILFVDYDGADKAELTDARCQ